MRDQCEAVRTCAGARHGDKPQRCTEKAEHVRNGRRVCWSHKRSLSVRYYIEAAVPLDTLLKVQANLVAIQRRQKIKQLREELARRQRRDKKKVCLVCANLAWRRHKSGCTGCGLAHLDESESAMRPRIT